MRTLIPLLVLSLVSTVSAAEAPGKPTYERLCISCHGADGKGDADMAVVEDGVIDAVRLVDLVE